MESARHVPPQIPSPAHSAASKDESKQIAPVQQSSDVKVGIGKEADALSEGKTINIRVHSLEKKAVKITDQSEVMPEPMSAREPISPESAPVHEDVQGKLVGGEQGSLSTTIICYCCFFFSICFLLTVISIQHFGECNGLMVVNSFFFYFLFMQERRKRRKRHEYLEVVSSILFQFLSALLISLNTEEIT